MIENDEKALAGRVIIAGFEGTSLPSHILDDLAGGSLGGIVLFSRNIESPEQVATLLAEARAQCPPDRPPIAAVDQEGGRVVRIREPLTVLPCARELAAAGDTDLTHRAGRLVGLELRALGFTLNFAPVLDVDTNPDSPVIGDRSYGREVGQVIGHGFAFARGLRDGGVHPCAKHFPGHGDAEADSHLSLPTVHHDRERLEAVEMEPFAAWARTGLGPIMTAHIVFPALDPDAAATTSRRILTVELRERMGFGGPIITDDLEMGAIGELGGPAAAAVATIKAGAHGLLVCRSEGVRAEVVAALASQANADPAFAGKLEHAANKLSTLGLFHGPAVGPDWIGSDSHLEMRQTLMNQLTGKRA